MPGPRAKSDPHLHEFGRRVRLLRVARGLTQEQLAHEAGLHRTVLGYIERGEREIGIGTLWPLAEALGIAVQGLFLDDRTPGDASKTL